MIARTDGLGSNLPTSAIISSGVAAAGSVVGTTAVATSLLATIGLSTAWVPFVGPIIAGVALAIAAFGVGNGCGQTCVIASQDADKIEPLMKQNLAAAQQQAQANGGWLTSAQHAAALQNFNDLWGALSNACSDPNLGDPGKRCVSDRQRGGKWDWFSYYYDPIAAIPVHDDSVLSSVTGGNSSLLLIGGGLLIGLAVLSAATGKD